MPLQLTNTLSGKKENFIPIKPLEVSIYVCGVTLYDSIHIGHLKSILSFEVIRNYFKSQNFKVSYVRNITDVDDKIINKAISKNIEPLFLVNSYIKEFHELLNELEINPPDVEPRVTQSLDNIIKFIKNLQTKGFAYETSDGIYFNTTKLQLETYPLSKKTISDLEKFSRLKSKSYERESKSDFALWKKDEKYGFSSSIFKQLGRPGWHIECSSMHYETLGPKFDIHGGGRDLIFPHHENEIVQSVAHNGNNPANYWLHNGMVTKNGQKLSKSLGNSIFVKDIIQQYSKEGLKLFLLKSHYASPQEFDENELIESDNRWKKFINNFPYYHKNYQSYFVYDKTISYLEDDFNTPAIISLLYQSLQELQTTLSLELALEIFKTFQLLSVVSDKKELYDYYSDLIIEEPSQEILDLMNLRWTYKTQNNFIQSDKLREDIFNLGWSITDYKDSFVYFKH